MREVYVLGVGQTVFGRFPQFSAVELGAKAARAAILDAGIDPKKLEVAYGGRSYDDTQTAENIMRLVGVDRLPMYNTENACTTGATCVTQLWKDIAFGAHDIGIAVCCEAMTTSSKSGKLVGAAEGDLNGTLGLTMPSYFAMAGQRLMHERGLTLSDLAYPSAKNHEHACGNPYAMYHKHFTTEDILNARMLSDPLTVLMCCPVTDGAASVILCTKEIAMRYTTRLVRMASSMVLSGRVWGYDFDPMDNPIVTELADLSYEASGFGPEDLDLVEIHEAFSPEEIYTWTGLRLCKPGDERKCIADGDFALGGRCPVNPSGGLLSLGHPLGASGCRVVVEVVNHLRGCAGERQVQGAKVGMAEMIGGYLTGIECPSIMGISMLTV